MILMLYWGLLQVGLAGGGDTNLKLDFQMLSISNFHPFDLENKNHHFLVIHLSIAKHRNNTDK